MDITLFLLALGVFAFFLPASGKYAREIYKVQSWIKQSSREALFNLFGWYSHYLVKPFFFLGLVVALLGATLGFLVELPWWSYLLSVIQIFWALANVLLGRYVYDTEELEDGSFTRSNFRLLWTELSIPKPQWLKHKHAYPLTWFVALAFSLFAQGIFLEVKALTLPGVELTNLEGARWLHAVAFLYIFGAIALFTVFVYLLASAFKKLVDVLEKSLTFMEHVLLPVLPGITVGNVREMFSEVDILPQELIKSVAIKVPLTLIVMWLPYSLLVFWVPIAPLAILAATLTVLGALVDQAYRYVSESGQGVVDSDERTEAIYRFFFRYYGLATVVAFALGWAIRKFYLDSASKRYSDSFFNMYRGIVPWLVLDKDWKTYVLYLVLGTLVLIALRILFNFFKEFTKLTFWLNVVIALVGVFLLYNAIALTSVLFERREFTLSKVYRPDTQKTLRIKVNDSFQKDNELKSNGKELTPVILSKVRIRTLQDGAGILELRSSSEKRRLPLIPVKLGEPGRYAVRVPDGFLPTSHHFRIVMRDVDGFVEVSPWYTLPLGKQGNSRESASHSLRIRGRNKRGGRNTSSRKKASTSCCGRIDTPELRALYKEWGI